MFAPPAVVIPPAVATRDAHTALLQANIPNTSNEEAFSYIYNKHVWGHFGHGSGKGSELGGSMGAAHILFHVVLLLNITSMVDAPCGGMLWQKRLLPRIKQNMTELRYLGVDVVRSVIDKNKATFLQWPYVTFLQQDLAQKDLPQGYDLIFSRDALPHVRLSDVWRILRRFAASDATWILLGSYPCRSLDKNASSMAICQNVNKEISPGGYRPIDLSVAPFDLPAPYRVYDEGWIHGKHLYLYKRSDLANALMKRIVYSW